MSGLNRREEERRSLGPAYVPPVPPRESKGYAVFPTGDVSHTRAFSTGYGGGEYRREDTHPYQGQMERDYMTYKATSKAFKAAATNYNDTIGAMTPKPGKVQPSTMATYGPGVALTPPEHRALIEPAAQASRLAYETNHDRAYFEEQHVGRGFKDLEDHLKHRKQKDQLLEATENFAVDGAKHTKYAAYPEYRQPRAGSSKKGRK